MLGVAVAAIKIFQTGLLATPAGQARRDVLKGVPVTLRNGDDTGVTSWRWRLLYRPPGSTATITNPNSAVATITPDKDGGTYHVALEVNGGSSALGEAQDRVFRVPDAAGLAVPAAAEQGPAANYIVDSTPNVWGWADEYIRRFHHSVDNRLSPISTSISAGATHNFSVTWPLHDAVLQILEVTAPGTTDIDIRVATDAAFANVVLEMLAVNPTNGVRVYEHRTITWPVTGLTGTVYFRVKNNDADDTFTIGYRLGAL